MTGVGHAYDVTNVAATHTCPWPYLTLPHQPKMALASRLPERTSLEKQLALMRVLNSGTGCGGGGGSEGEARSPLLADDSALVPEQEVLLGGCDPVGSYCANADETAVRPRAEVAGWGAAVRLDVVHRGAVFVVLPGNAGASRRSVAATRVDCDYIYVVRREVSAGVHEWVPFVRVGSTDTVAVLDAYVFSRLAPRVTLLDFARLLCNEAFVTNQLHIRARVSAPGGEADATDLSDTELKAAYVAPLIDTCAARCTEQGLCPRLLYYIEQVLAEKPLGDLRATIRRVVALCPWLNADARTSEELYTTTRARRAALLATTTHLGRLIFQITAIHEAAAAIKRMAPLPMPEQHGHHRQEDRQAAQQPYMEQ